MTRWTCLVVMLATMGGGVMGCGEGETLEGEALPAGVLSGDAKADAAYTFPGGTNVAISGTRAYIAGSESLAILDLAAGGGQAYRLRAHDVAVDGNLLYVLDAVAPGLGADFGNQGGKGTLRVIDFTNPSAPFYAAPAISVPVGPFSGVAAAAGRFVVSGGTGSLTAGTLSNGKLTTSFSLDLGTGQPDVTLSADGKQAYVSTDFDGNNFGITVLDMITARVVARIPLVSGTSRVLNGPGQFAPANFGIESAVSGNILVTAHHDGLARIDLTRLSGSPITASLTTTQLGVVPVNVDIRGNTAFVVGSSPRPRLVTVDLSTFKVVAQRDLTGTPTSVAVSDRHIVAIGGTGIQVLDRQAPAPTPTPSAGCTTPASYEVQLVGTWTDRNVPDAHFSAPVVATHGASGAFWALGQKASRGLKLVAEEGQPDPLGTELRAKIPGGTIGEVAHKSISGYFFSPGESDTLRFTATERHSYVSLVSMVAPSPDWFTGVSALSLCRNGSWISGETVELKDVYDAGTDSGTAFAMSPNVPTASPANISIDRTHFSGPVGYLTFTRVQ